MKRIIYLFIFFFSLLTTNISADNIMILKLSYGEVEIELYPDKAPNHVKRFKELADSGKYNANAIIRGLRAVSDFEYEFQLAGMNKKLNSKIETMFLMSDLENQIISSKFVKEISKLGGNINKFVTKSTVKMLKNKF